MRKLSISSEARSSPNRVPNNFEMSFSSAHLQPMDWSHPGFTESLHQYAWLFSQLISKPKTSLNWLRIWMRFRIESKVLTSRNTKVSSTNWEINCVLLECGSLMPTISPSISAFRSMIFSTSVTSINKEGVRGQPCVTPLLISNGSVAFLLTNTDAVAPVNNNLTKLMK